MITPATAPITALILAGKRTQGDLVAMSDNKDLKAFVDIHGTAMIDYVLKALEKIPAVKRLIVCLPADTNVIGQAPLLEELVKNGKAKIITAESGPSASVLKAFNEIEAGHDMLLTTADHPLLTPKIVTQFLETAIKNEDLSVAMAPLALVQDTFPKTKRTRLCFKDGCYSGCNLFYFKGETARNVLHFWQRLERFRKKPWRMAFSIGPLVLLGYALCRLTLAQIFAAIGKKSGTRITPVILDVPQAAIDVDSIEDLAFVRDLLNP